MLDKLLEKYHSYTEEKCNNFHHNVPRDMGEGKTFWEIDTNGYYIIRHDRCYYLSNQGEAHLLAPKSNYLDWKKHIELYKIVCENKECRIDIPISNIMVNDKLSYRIYQRPNHEFGVDYHVDVFDGIVDTDYFLEYIDQVQILIVNMLRVSDNLPMIGITPMKRFKDSLGYFWTDFKRWTLPKDQFVSSALDSINTTVNYLVYNKLSNLDHACIMDIAKKKWTII